MTLSFATIASDLVNAEKSVAKAEYNQVQAIAHAIAGVQSLVPSDDESSGVVIFNTHLSGLLSQAWHKAGNSDATINNKTSQYRRIFNALYGEANVVEMCAAYRNLKDLTVGVIRPLLKDEAPIAAPLYYGAIEAAKADADKAKALGRPEGTTATPQGNAEKIRKLIIATYDAGKREAIADALNFVFETPEALDALHNALENICNDFQE